jgi:hypothetical protein
MKPLSMVRNVKPSRLIYALAAAVVFTVACRSEVPPERMKAVAAWATAVCACAQEDAQPAKQCATGLKQPPSPVGEFGSGGAPKYSKESLNAYIDIESQGLGCQRTIQLR